MTTTDFCKRSRKESRIGSFFRFDSVGLRDSLQYDVSTHNKLGQYDERIKHGTKIKWLKGRHQDPIDLEPYRLIGDKELDNIFDLCHNEKRNGVVGRFDDTVGSCAKVHQKYMNHKDKPSFVSSLSSCDHAMLLFYDHYHQNIPSWVDWNQLQRGMDLFITFLPSAGMMLFYGSLVPGFSIPKIGKVLFQTKYLAPPSTRQQVIERLKDTGLFLQTVMSDLSEHGNRTGIPAFTLRPGNPGWIVSLQVRALHAKVRNSILKRKTANNCDGKGWNTNLYGIPINQEDLAATLLAFSVNVIVGVELISGKSLSKDEKLDYLALWRYIGWLLGVETDTSGSRIAARLVSKEKPKGKSLVALKPLDPCGPSSQNGDDSLVHAYSSLESMVWHLMTPDESSITVAHHLLSMSRNDKFSDLKHKKKDSGPETGKIIIDSSSPFMSIFRALMCRRFITEELADALNLPRVEWNIFSIKSLLAHWLTTFFLLMMRIYTLLTINYPWFRKIAYARHNSMIAKVQVASSKSHLERMGREFSTGRKTFAEKRVCPFAMVMSPD